MSNENKAGQGEAVAYAYEYGKDNGDGSFSVTITRGQIPSYLMPVKEWPVKPLYLAPPASADAVSVAPGLERAIQIVREVAKTQPGYSDEREAIFEALSEAYVEAKAPQPPPASADAVLVSRELLERLCPITAADGWKKWNTATAYEAAKELRALLAQSESEG